MKNNTIETHVENNEATAPLEEKAVLPFRGKTIRILLCAVILAVGITGANVLIKTAPTAKRRPPAKMMPLVRVQTVHPTSHRLIVSVMGTVVPAREIVLKSRVSGEIVKTHGEFTEGGFLPKGTEVLEIDDADYTLAVEQKQSAVAGAIYALKLELGHQEVAKREWALLKDETNESQKEAELALRQPHLERVEAELAAAEADLKQARLDLGRTKIRAPFNAILRSKQVEIGSQVSTQDSLAVLAGTDEYWVQVSVPTNRLDAMTIPRGNQKRGSTARIFYRNGAERSGHVYKLLSDLEPDGRMARVLVSVLDPLSLKHSRGGQPPLLIGEFVRVEIDGEQVDHVYRIPRSALRDDQFVWIASKDNTLQIRQVDTFWRDDDTVLLKEGLQPGERLIISDLATPVTGIPLKIENVGDRSSRGKNKTASPKPVNANNG